LRNIKLQLMKLIAENEFTG